MSGTELAQVTPSAPPVVAIEPRRTFSLTPTNLDEAIRFSELIAESDLAPKDFKGKPGNVLVAVQMGAELGIPPLQAIQNIAVINGRPAVWGDLFLAVIQASPVYAWHRESFDEETMTAVCQMMRRGAPEPVTRAFSQADAQAAGLWGKKGSNGQATPWVTYPKRMLQMRARAFAGRDAFADVLRGIALREEVEDYLDGELVPEPAPIQLPRRKSEASTAPQAAPVAAPEPAKAEPKPVAAASTSAPPEPEPEAERDTHGEEIENGLVQQISTKAGTSSNGKSWTKNGIKVNGTWHNTFDTKHAQLATEAKNAGLEVTIWYTTDQYGRQIQDISIGGAASASPDADQREAGTDDDVPF